MRAVIVRDFGGVDTVQLGDWPDPVPGPNEVLLKVEAVAANYVDTLVIGGTYQFLPPRPFVPGKGPVGVVQAVGEAVRGLAPGDRILAMAEIAGYAELAVAPADQCYRLPQNLSFVDAASMSLAYDTAWFALHERGRLAAGETVLVLGATGAVGFAAMQLARAAGALVIAGVSSMDKADLVRAGGAAEVVDLGVPNLRDSLRDQIHAVTKGRGADVVIDMLGGDIFDAALRGMAWAGRLVVVGFASGRIPSLKANYLLLKNIEVSGLQISDYRKRKPALVRRCFEEVFALYEAGQVLPPPSRSFALADAASALRALLDRRVRERIILLPGG